MIRRLKYCRLSKLIYRFTVNQVHKRLFFWDRGAGLIRNQQAVSKIFMGKGIRTAKTISKKKRLMSPDFKTIKANIIDMLLFF